MLIKEYTHIYVCVECCIDTTLVINEASKLLVNFKRDRYDNLFTKTL